MNLQACLKFVIAFALAIGTANAYSDSGGPSKGPLVLNDITMQVWGSYKINQMLFPNEEWEFFVIVVPTDVRQGTLIDVAKAFYSEYPNKRARFFSDDTHIQQYVDRDRYMNDTSGTVKEVAFPDQKWVQNHQLGNINNRSSTWQRHWMLEDRYGNNISLLP